MKYIIFLTGAGILRLIYAGVRGGTEYYMKGNGRLFIAFAALLSFQACYLRLNFSVVEKTGLTDSESLIFILYCAAIALGLVAAPLCADRFRTSDSPARLNLAARICLALTAASAVAGYFAKGYAALALQFTAVLIYAGVMALVMRRISVCLTPDRVGRFVGFSFALMHVSCEALFYLPLITVPSGAALFVICVFLAVAGFSFDGRISGAKYEAADSAPFANYIPFTAKIIRLALAALGIFAVVGGIQDNIFFFGPAFDAVPDFIYYTFLYNIIVYAVVGSLFKRVDPALAVICGFALICAGQSMSFFSGNTLLVYPYTFFANAGYITLEVYLVSLPIAYSAHAKRRTGVLPGLGYMVLYIAFFVMAVIFEFMPSSFYMPALGVLLLLSLAAILLTVYLLGENKAHKFALIQSELNKFSHNIAGAKLIEPLTGREREVLKLILAGKSNKEITAEIAVGESTVKFHAGNIYSKYGVSGRAELISSILTKRINNVGRDDRGAP